MGFDFDFGHIERTPNFDTYGFSWPGGPDYEPPAPPRCEQCGGFLPWDPDSREPWEDTIDCDGSAQRFDEERTGALLDILGPGTDAWYVSPCGDAGGPHTPHREVLAAGETFRTKCRKCGHETVDRGF